MKKGKENRVNIRKDGKKRGKGEENERGGNEGGMMERRM